MVMTAVKGCGQSDQSPGEVGSQGASLNRRHDLGLKHLCKDLGKSVAGRRKTTGVSQDIWAPPPLLADVWDLPVSVVQLLYHG